jgi:hypothetical protein
VSWRYDVWTAVHRLPLGLSRFPDVGQPVRAGDIIAAGTTYGAPVRVPTARRLGVAPSDLGSVLRASLGAEVEKGALIARTGRRFVRAVSAPIDGRIVHIRADGDIELAPVVDRWIVRSTLDGTVTASDDTAVTVEGAAWGFQGLAGYGPDAIGELTLSADGPSSEMVPSRIDVRQRGRILVGGSRGGAEAIARAHACGAAGVIAGAVPAGGLRVVFGDDVSAQGSASRSDTPTVLCLLGFGHAPLPSQVFGPIATLAGSRAAIHTASARLFVFAPADALSIAAQPASLALVGDWGAVRVLDGAATLAEGVRFPSELTTAAVVTAEGPIPSANVKVLV